MKKYRRIAVAKINIEKSKCTFSPAFIQGLAMILLQVEIHMADKFIQLCHQVNNDQILNCKDK